MLANYPGGQRDMANPAPISSYSEYENERDNNQPYGEVDSHDGGEFFSSILWDIHNAVGAGETDELVYKTLHGISDGPTFMEFRDVIINEAGQNYSPQDANTVQDAFAAKGVGDFVPLNVTISGPHFFPMPDQSGTWTTSVSGGTSPYSYLWLRRPTASPNQQWQQVGHNSTYSGSASGDTDFTLKVEVTDPNPRSGERTIDIRVGTIDPPPCTYCN